MAWEGVPRALGDKLYRELSATITKFGNPTSRRCGLNDDRTCACQGKDPDSCGASFSFGCSWSMYFNGCKYARSKTPRKFRLAGDHPQEEDQLRDNFQDLATELAPLYKQLAPQAYNNQCQNEVTAPDCRLGLKEGRPFSGVTACMDFCAHAHKDQHNLYNGCTVVCTLTKEDNRTVGEIPEDEQLHVLPLYKAALTDEFGSEEGQRQKMRTGAIQVLSNFRREVRKLPEPAKSCRQRRLDAKNRASEKKKAKQQLPTPTETPDKTVIKTEVRHAGSPWTSANTPTTSTPPTLATTHGEAPLPMASPLHFHLHQALSMATTPIYPQHCRTAITTIPPTLTHFSPVSSLTRAVTAPGITQGTMLPPALWTRSQTGTPVIKQEPMDVPVCEGGNTQSCPDTPIPTPQPGGPWSGHKPNGSMVPGSWEGNPQPPCPPGAPFTSDKQQVHQQGPHQTSQSPYSQQQHQYPPQQPSPYPQQWNSYPGPNTPKASPVPSPSPSPSPHPGTPRHWDSPAPSPQPKAWPMDMVPAGYCPSPARGFPDKICSKAGESRSSTPLGLQEKAWNQRGRDLDEEEQWSDSEHNFLDPSIGGVAVAPAHGSILIECARRELHATTPLKRPDRSHPTRISLVFYQHKNMNQPCHGQWLWEAKMKMLAERARERQQEAALLGLPYEDIKPGKKRKLGATAGGASPGPGQTTEGPVMGMVTRLASTHHTTSTVTVSPYAFTTLTGPYSHFV
ncbi:unnamed protein product [Oncorhynchus mykiss]|uniref:Methylcytosine dioxygenase TET n=1 Tax=Oncorhynchus mykiss TaxID=8022 RepID=A0A060X0S8_ONCMY|nr:unnamed protein product [Oncorhynchus mykiss]